MVLHSKPTKDLKQIGHDLTRTPKSLRTTLPRQSSPTASPKASALRHGAWGLEVWALESGRRTPRVLAYLPCAIEHLTFCVFSFLSSERGLIIYTLQSISENDIRYMR